jgi:23S rRNA pseudouridine955/2504/2580 synthase
MSEQDLKIIPRRSAVQQVEVDADSAGVRLDKWLGKHWPLLPRSRLFRLIRKGEVRVNGKRAQPEQRLLTGDRLRLPPIAARPPLPASHGAAADVATAPAARSKAPPTALLERMRSAVIHEDARLLVIDKPAGLAVHGGSGTSFGVIETLRALRPQETLELVHRLDRDTSGVLLVARKHSVLRELHAQLRGDEGTDGFDKHYLALVRGSWQLGAKRIDAPLRTDLRVGGERTVRVMVGGKSAVSFAKPVQFFGKVATLVEVRIETGRTHQIRVHLAHAGHPVAGDDKYGDTEFNSALRLLGLKRMFLHAASLSFTWPGNRGDFSANAPLPSDLKALLERLSGGDGKSRAPSARRSRAGRSPRSDRRLRPARPS